MKKATANLISRFFGVKVQVTAAEPPRGRPFVHLPDRRRGIPAKDLSRAVQHAEPTFSLGDNQRT